MVTALTSPVDSSHYLRFPSSPGDNRVYSRGSTLVLSSSYFWYFVLVTNGGLVRVLVKNSANARVKPEVIS
ncbi:hypothetical protein AFLA_011841 [Aspergillus flavus NRRL3357]|nr:hypothetical protein AFLA_011841 [Aspergillus flavus NRRL3357]